MTRSRLIRPLAFASLAFVAGATGGWWLNQPAPPWLEVVIESASYTRGSQFVDVAGQYTARRTCSRAEQGTPADAPDPLVWRQEVQGTGPQVVVLSPSPAPPVLELGTHWFEIGIPLEKGIEPDGWKVAALVSCDTEPYAVRSRSVLVEYLPRHLE